MISPYAASKIVNSILDENGVAPIPSQMMYNYSKNGMITTYVVNGKKMFDENGTGEKDFSVWLMKYIAMKGIVVITDDAPQSEVLF